MGAKERQSGIFSGLVRFLKKPQMPNPQVAAAILFDGTGTPAIVSSYNVDSITDHGTGDYTINFAAGALQAGNYYTAFSVPGAANAAIHAKENSTVVVRTKDALRILVTNGTTAQDVTRVGLIVYE